MLVFITNPRSFREKKLENSSVELIYIFNSKTLYKKLSTKYKCVNINNHGNIIDENFFPKRGFSKQFQEKLFFMRKELFIHFKKKYIIQQRNFFQTSNSVNDFEMKSVFAFCNRWYKKDISKTMHFLNQNINQQIINLCLYKDKLKNIEQRKKFISFSNKIANYIYSFFRAYIYSFGIKKRGVEVLGDYVRYNFFVDVLMEICKFKKFDMDILSKMFVGLIEEINIEEMINNLINSNKEKGFI